MAMTKYKPCPCWSKLLYHKCCKPYHDGALPDNALALMRSRYSAYALNLVDYIVGSTHPSNPQYNADLVKWKSELSQFSSGFKFDGLKINQFVDGPESATVSFTASITGSGGDASFSETSIFVKESGKWFYKSGDVVDS